MERIEFFVVNRYSKESDPLTGYVRTDKGGISGIMLESLK